MDEYRVFLMGHRDFCATREVEDKLIALLHTWVSQHTCVEILIGRNGAFDIFAASVVKRTQKAVGKERLSMTLWLPYAQKDLLDYEQYYDAVVLWEGERRVHPKRAITERNRGLVEQCDLFVCCLRRSEGGVYAAWKYAQKLEKATVCF